MIQLIFFTLFMLTLLAGAFVYFTPAEKPLDPMKFMMENSGYNSVELVNHKRIQRLNITTIQGLVKIREQMDDLATEQNKFLDTIQDQQQMLMNTGKEATTLMLEAQQEAQRGNRDVLQLKSLASNIQDQERLLVARGQDLIVLNDELMKNRKWISDQVNAGNVNTETSLERLQQRYAKLKDQAADFFDKAARHNQEMHDQMNKMQDQLNGLAITKEHTGRMLDHEREDMVKLTDNEERIRDLIEEQRQKAQDQQRINQQHEEDQKQRVQDQQEQQRINQQREEDQKQQMQDRQNLQN